MENKSLSRKNGFTLIELLVVISIIGTLSSVVLASLSGTRDKASDTKKVMEVRSMDTAIKLYESTKGTVPGNYLRSNGTLSDTSLDPTVSKPAKEGDSTYSTQAYERSMGELVTGGVLPSIPRSPDGKSYTYFNYGGSDGSGATFFATKKSGEIIASTDNPSSRDVRRIADINRVNTVIDSYYASKSRVPSTLQDLVTNGFMSSAPIDPLNSGQYVYTYTYMDTTTYQMCMYLETVAAPDNQYCGSESYMPNPIE
ncbi:MAG: type II secretion system protein [Candidatus Paceibacterota bacterium]|jgi:prepilin-type N-terminal cleavage/methylation domain-containing protein